MKITLIEAYADRVLYLLRKSDAPGRQNIKATILFVAGKKDPEGFVIEGLPMVTKYDIELMKAFCDGSRIDFNISQNSSDGALIIAFHLRPAANLESIHKIAQEAWLLLCGDPSKTLVISEVIDDISFAVGWISPDQVPKAAKFAEENQLSVSLSSNDRGEVLISFLKK